MTDRVYNFGAGPAMLPEPVMRKIQEEWLNYRGMGVSIIEISHRADAFIEVLEEAKALFRELTDLPDNYRILFMHGGARMVFSALPLNLAGRCATRKCLYAETGNFAKVAAQEAQKFCQVKTVISSAAGGYDHIPELPLELIDQDAAYLHITGNNTIFGTRWNTFPETGKVPLIADMTSELLSRRIDYRRFGAVYAGLQKNLGPSGMAMVIIRDDLLGFADAVTPTLLDFTQADKDNSLTNTTNTFAVYVIKLVLEWLQEQGGVAAMEEINEAKAARLYQVIDDGDFYRGIARKDHRSIMNVSFLLNGDGLTAKFLQQAEDRGLYALKGYRSVGGVRASIYNPMPMVGVEKLATFMEEFAARHG
ncbi:3-phosphoserine/phosphohydroxythreonine transaminase [Pelovirga terrestris]|uniref:Phosphoserine aminotransferase n=1 Tax=Pelovirga terrestris TaxID=2771352 RepID=A0A8J6UIM6_9BACT|nr:3-phosphoserine/phosphohydroxythreonine transaminase [Pelovirga terrestris]MBD1401295.1 3-phosphoserine/phosphohydroxythreonine transaminase [Pelovirga terrestris]